jgi:hypothetical protein
MKMRFFLIALMLGTQIVSAQVNYPFYGNRKFISTSRADTLEINWDQPGTAILKSTGPISIPTLVQQTPLQVSPWTTTDLGIKYVYSEGDSSVFWRDGTIHLYKSGSEILYTTSKGAIGQKYNSLFNTAVGDSALCRNTIGNNNTAIGNSSLYFNTTGYFNTAVGLYSLYSNTIGGNNTALGLYSLYSNTTGYTNTAIGYNSLYSNITGYYNTALGYSSLYFNTTGTFNTALGNSSLYSNTTGYSNTALGYNSLSSNTTAPCNTAIGVSSLFTNTGTNNLAIGYYSGYYNTTQSNRGYINCYDQGSILGDTTKSIAYWYQDTDPLDSRFYINAGKSYFQGDVYKVNSSGANTDTLATKADVRAGSGSGGSSQWTSTGSGIRYGNGLDSLVIWKDGTIHQYKYGNEVFYTTDKGFVGQNDSLSNTAIGLNSLYSNTSGYDNTAIGAYSLNNNTTGNHNTAIGKYSLTNNSTGSYNTTIGLSSLVNNTTGLDNTAIGFGSTASNTTGNRNTAIGAYSLNDNTTGNYNTAIGLHSLYQHITGNNNIAIGKDAGFYNTTLSNRGFINALDQGNLRNDTTKSPFYWYQDANPALSRLYFNAGKSYFQGSVFLTNSSNANTDTLATKADIRAASGSGGSSQWITNGRGIKYTHSGGDSSVFWRNGTIHLYKSGAEVLYTTDKGFIGQKYNSLYNTVFGDSALNRNTTGYSNTANGYNALRSNTTGTYNTANGNNTLYSNTTGTRNTANGYYALYFSTTGGYNTANGADALRSNTTGYSNTANGSDALSYNTTGYSNTATGSNALRSNTTGPYNTANGIDALYSNTTGNYNTANGSKTLYSNTTGYYNTANGSDALYSNITGYNNTANGNRALRSNTTGYSNNANGYGALNSNTTGNYNTAIGYYAGYYNTTLSNRGFINALNQGSLANDTTKSPFYWYQNADPALSRIYLNAGNIYTSGSLHIVSTIKQTQLTCALTDDTPTAVEIVSCAGSAAMAGAGTQRTIKDSSGSGKLYRIESDGTDWYYVVTTKAL